MSAMMISIAIIEMNNQCFLIQTCSVFLFLGEQIGQFVAPSFKSEPQLGHCLLAFVLIGGISINK